MVAVYKNSVVLVKEKRTSQGSERGLFTFILWGIPSTYTPQLGKNREEQNGEHWTVYIMNIPNQRCGRFGCILVWGLLYVTICANGALTGSLPLAASAPAPDYICQDDGCLQRLSEL